MRSGGKLGQTHTEIRQCGDTVGRWLPASQRDAQSGSFPTTLRRRQPCSISMFVNRVSCAEWVPWYPPDFLIWHYLLISKFIKFISGNLWGKLSNCFIVCWRSICLRETHVNMEFTEVQEGVSTCEQKFWSHTPRKPWPPSYRLCDLVMDLTLVNVLPYL